MKMIEWFVIEQLSRPRYDGAETIIWVNSDDINYFKKACSFMMDCEGDLDNFYCVIIYDDKKYDKIKFVDYCKQEKIISMRGKQYD